MKIFIDPVQNKKEWHKAIIVLSSDKVAIGYGKGHMEALKDALKDKELIESLSK